MEIEIRELVKTKYGSVATSGLSSDQDGVKAVAEAFGYSPEELAAIPAAANMGLSCGNPIATANLRPGEVVIDLAPDKKAVFREIARVLRPSGRLAVSDIALKKPLRPEIGSDLMAYVGCVAGAIPIEEYRHGLLEAGFAHVDVVDSGADLNAYAKLEHQAGCCGTAPTGDCDTGPSSCCNAVPGANTSELLERLGDLLSRYDLNDYAASVKVYAVKPA